MRIIIEQLETVPLELKVELLDALIGQCYLWWFKDTLRILEVPNRTRHYKAFSWSSYDYRAENASQDRAARRLQTCREILQTTTITDWGDAFLQEWSIKRFTNALRHTLDSTTERVSIKVS